MKAFKNKKLIIILTIITTVITLISGTFSFWVRMYLFYKLKINSNEAASIGIIGSSDGPTSIFITGILSTNSITIMFGLLSVIGIIYLIFINKLQK